MAIVLTPSRDDDGTPRAAVREQHVVAWPSEDVDGALLSTTGAGFTPLEEAKEDFETPVVDDEVPIA